MAPRPVEVIRFIARSAKRLAVTVVGAALVVAGLAMLVLPGPGFVVVAIGFAVLGTEYVWAAVALEHTKRLAARGGRLAKDAASRAVRRPRSRRRDTNGSERQAVAVPSGDRYVRPGWFTARVFNPVVAWLTRRGLSVAGSRVLEVRGRTSGEWRAVPVNLLTLDGESFLVAPRGQTQWVRNLRAAGEGRVRIGRRIETFTAVELADHEKPPVIRRYLERWGWEVGTFFDDLDKHADDAALLAAAPGFPVFRVDRSS